MELMLNRRGEDNGGACRTVTPVEFILMKSVAFRSAPTLRIYSKRIAAFLHLKTKGCCLVVNREGSCSSSQKDIVVVATGKDVD